MEGDRFIGREIAGYRIEELIGRGGMGVVYRAEHQRLGRRVAFKVVAPEITNEPRFRERFLRESRTAGALDHPNVVPIYDAGEAEGVLYMAMRLVDGTDLATLIEREGRLVPGRAASIVAQVAAALDGAHEAGLIHRDVKPSNVLIPAGGGRREHAYLGDFGLTKRLSSQSGVTASAAFLGTIAYVAPEQIEGKAVDARADQYSLACVAYECLTGHRPFEKEGDIAVLWAHMQDPFPSVAAHGLGDLAPVVDPILQRAAAKDPEDRYPSCGDFAAALEAALPSTASQTTTPTGEQAAPPLPGPANARAGMSPALRRVAIWVPIGTVLAVGTVAVLAWRLLFASPPAPLLAGAGVLTIDATTSAVSGTVDLGSDPSSIAADASGAWVVLPTATQVVQLEPDGGTNEVTLEVRPLAVAVGGDRVWVISNTAKSLLSIDPTNLGRTPRTQSLTFRPAALAVGGEYVWIVDAQEDQVFPIDFDGRPENAVGTGAGPNGVAATDELVFVTNGLDQSVTRITIAGFFVEGLDLDFSPVAIAAAGNDLWLVNADRNEVVRYDVRTRALAARIAVGARPSAIALSEDAAWVANAADGTVSRISFADNTATTIVVAGRPVGIAVSGDLVWVAIAAD